MKRTCFCLGFACAMSLVAVGGSIWEDAKVLTFSNFANGSTPLAEGTAIKGSDRWVNDRNLTALDGAYNPGASYGVDQTGMMNMYTVKNEDVRILGEGGVTYLNEPCLHFEPYVNATGAYQTTFFTFPCNKEGSGMGSHGNLDLSKDHTYTVCMRFKPGLCTPSANWTDRVLLDVGPGNGNDAVQLTYKVAPDGTYGNIYVRQCGGALWVGSTGSVDSQGKRIGDNELMITNGVWADIVFICASNRIDVGVRHELLFRADDRGLAYGSTQGGRRFTWKSGTYDPVATGKSLVPPYNYNRFNVSYNWNPTTEANNRNIAGSLHRYGYWKRALTRDEVYEYFSEGKRPNLLTIGPGGTGDAGTKMFRGTAGTAVTIGNRPGEWYRLPAILNKDVANTVNFSVDASYAGLPQVLKVTAAATSAAGTVAVTLDGAPLATLDVTAGGKKIALIDGEKFTAGAHTLSYARTDSGSGNLVINSLELKGSWQVGKDDGIYSQNATRDDFTSSHIFAWSQYGYNPASAANGWLCDFAAGPRHAWYGGNVETYDMRLSFPVDPDLLAARYRFRYEFKIANVAQQWAGTKWTYTMNFNDNALVTSFTDEDYGAGSIVKVPLDDCLHGGSNTNKFSVRVTDPGQGVEGHYNDCVYADYYRLRIIRPIDGTLLLFR